MPMERLMSSQRLDRFAAAWLECNLDELSAYLTCDVVYSPLSGEAVRGREAVLQRFAKVLADDHLVELAFEPSVVAGALGACRWRMRRPTREDGDLETEGVDLYEFQGDRIRVQDVYQKPS